MILYFSSTGNCKYVAECLARELGDCAASIMERNSLSLKAGEKLGFVFPTYFWRLPSIVDDYMRALTIAAEDREPYLFFVATYGSTCGQTGTFMKRHLRAKGFALSASFSIKMADDWSVWFDLSNRAEVEAIVSAEGPQLKQILGDIRACRRGNRMKGTLPMIAVMGSGFFYDRARRTSHLHVEDGCVGCGRCAKECPVSAIELKQGKPVWVKDKCAMCLHCLHSCPKFAIQYDDKTRQHGQYHHDDFL